MNRWDPYRAWPVVIFADPSEGPPYYVPYYDKQGVLNKYGKKLVLRF